MDFGFGDDDAPLKLPGNLKKKTRPKSDRPAVDHDALAEISEEAGFQHPSEKRAKRKKTPAKAKRELPQFGPMPLDASVRSEPRGNITINAPKRILERFERIKSDYDKPAWVIMALLVETYEKYEQENDPR